MKRFDWRAWLVVTATVVAVAVWGSVGWYLWFTGRQEESSAGHADVPVVTRVKRQGGRKGNVAVRSTPTATRARVGSKATQTPKSPRRPRGGGGSVATSTPTPVSLSAGSVGGTYAIKITDPGIGDLDRVWQRVLKLPAGKKVLVTVHDDHLTREANAYLAQHPEYPYSDVAIAFSEKGFTAGGTIDAQGVSLQVTVRGTLGARYCKPWVKVNSVQLGGVNAPPAVYRNVTGMIAKAMEQYPDDLPICVAEVRTTEGALVAVGVMK